MKKRKETLWFVTWLEIKIFLYLKHGKDDRIIVGLREISINEKFLDDVLVTEYDRIIETHF